MYTKIELCTHEKRKLISKKRMPKEFGPQRIRHDQTWGRDRQVGKVFIFFGTNIHQNMAIKKNTKKLPLGLLRLGLTDPSLTGFRPKNERTKEMWVGKWRFFRRSQVALGRNLELIMDLELQTHYHRVLNQSYID